VDVAPELLFGPGAGSGEGAFTHLFFAVSAEGPETVVKPVDPGEVAARMVHSLDYERAPFRTWYQMFRFAFPELSNPHVEQASERERALLGRVLAGRPAYVVTHPYPVEIPRLFEAVEPYLR
jgi:hypothetical protein